MALTDEDLIDTPGIRELQLWDSGGMNEAFADVEDLAAACRFNDCSHLHEPDCEVKRRVESGAIPRARYDTYVRLADDLKNGQT